LKALAPKTHTFPVFTDPQFDRDLLVLDTETLQTRGNTLNHFEVLDEEVPFGNGANRDRSVVAFERKSAYDIKILVLAKILPFEYREIAKDARQR
jgi:hypothetical protein